MRVLRDADLERVSMVTIVDAIRAFVVADARGLATSPPRQGVDFPDGRIVFTSGGLGDLAGFRAYETFRAPYRGGEDQIVAVWNTRTGALEGVCLGAKLGALRTGALGGIAVDALAPETAATCAIIGTGQQARTQLLGILACRRLTQVRVYSRDAARREAFVAGFAGDPAVCMIACASTGEAVAGADIVVLATDATSPVIDASMLAEAAHVTTLGPKLAGAHELPLDAVVDRLIVSDSPQQIRGLGERHMLHGHPCLAEMHHLGEILAIERPAAPRRSLYLSAGLAGTEVVALAVALHPET